MSGRDQPINGMRGRVFGRRNAATLGSSILSSGTNAAVVLAASSFLGAASFGLFALLLMVALLVAAVTNGFTGFVSLSELSKSVAPEEHAGQSMAAAILISSSSALVALVAGLVYTVHGAEGALALGLPIAASLSVLGASVHAVARSIAFAEGRPMDAVRLDAFWLASIAVGIGMAYALGVANTPALLLTIWGGGAVVALAGTPSRRLIAQISYRRAAAWWGTHRKLGSSLAFNIGLQSGTERLVAAGLGLVVGLPALGGLRLAQTLMGPSTIFFSAARARVLPELSSPWATERHRARFLALLSLTLTVVPLAALSVLYVADPVLIRVVNEQTWLLTRRVLSAVGTASVFVALSQGPQMGLQALSQGGKIMRARATQAILIVSFGFLGVGVGSVQGAAWGIAAGYAVGAFTWWGAYWKSMNDRKGASATDHTDGR